MVNFSTDKMTFFLTEMYLVQVVFIQTSHFYTLLLNMDIIICGFICYCFQNTAYCPNYGYGKMPAHIKRIVIVNDEIEDKNQSENIVLKSNDHNDHTTERIDGMTMSNHVSSPQKMSVETTTAYMKINSTSQTAKITSKLTSSQKMIIETSTYMDVNGTQQTDKNKQIMIASLSIMTIIIVILFFCILFFVKRQMNMNQSSQPNQIEMIDFTPPVDYETANQHEVVTMEAW